MATTRSNRRKAPGQMSLSEENSGRSVEATAIRGMLGHGQGRKVLRGNGSRDLKSRFREHGSTDAARCAVVALVFESLGFCRRNGVVMVVVGMVCRRLSTIRR
ncbi:hypothetical protein ACMYR3_17165 (plasmid) [Ampullimonas aquatilis]|uniref:hypothetical protein n=1 Tax=Ampullimonas aquatilis TaxID=1341549 RepID=UPI003C723DDF